MSAEDFSAPRIQLYTKPKETYIPPDANALEGMYQKLEDETMRLDTKGLQEALSAANFKPEQQHLLINILQRTPTEFKGNKVFRTADTVAKDLQYVEQLATTTTLPEQKSFLAKLGGSLKQVVDTHPGYAHFKKLQYDPTQKKVDTITGIFKGVIAIGIMATAAMDIANKNHGLAALKAGLAFWILRIDKYLDPQLTQVNQVKFLTENRFTEIAKHNHIGGNEWAKLTQTLFTQSMRSPQELLNSPLISKEQKALFTTLSSYDQQKFIEQVRQAKSTAAQETVIDWIKGNGVKDTSKSSGKLSSMLASGRIDPADITSF